jgi:hypothetical protein
MLKFLLASLLLLSGVAQADTPPPVNIFSMKSSTAGLANASGGGVNPLIGASTQYVRGDATLQTLNTSVVTEGSNLYFTTARAQGALSVTSPVTYSLGVIGCLTASGSQNGCLSSTDWTTFNGKQSALTLGALTDAGTDGITVTGGSGAVVGSGTSISQHVADSTHNGYLGSTDWGTFNGKQGALTFTAPLVNTTGTVTCNAASGSQAGCLSSSDWTAFNGKGAGTMTAVSVASSNGFAGSSSGGATPALTLTTSITGMLKGNGTALSSATSGTDYSPGTSALSTGILKSTTTTGALSIAASGTDYSLGTSALSTGILKSTNSTGALTVAIASDFPTLNQNTTGSAGLNVLKAGDTMTGGLNSTFAGTASTPAVFLSGTPFSGGSGTTTKPDFLIEDAGTAFSSWNTSGTYIGVNSASTFSGDFININKSGGSRLLLTNAGAATFASTVQTPQLTIGTSGILSTGNNLPVIVGSTRTFSTADQVQVATSTNNASSGVKAAVDILPVYNQTSTAGGTDLLINRTETAVGSGAQLLIDAQVASSSKFNVSHTGVVTSQAGSASAPTINFGTANTGLYGGSSTAFDVTVGGVKSVEVGANIFSVFNTGGAGLAVDATSTANIFLERAGANPFMQISTKGTGGAALDWLCFGANNGCSLATTPYPYMIRTAPADGAVTSLSSFVVNDGNVVNGLPMDILVNGASTANALACRMTAGSSYNVMGAACTRHVTQTSAAEVSEFLLANQDSGILTEHLRVKQHGLVEGGGAIPSVTCNSNTATVETGSSGAFGRFTVPSSPGTSCVVTIPDTADSKPICSATYEPATGTAFVALAIGCTSTTSCTIPYGSLVAADKISFHCGAHF